MTAMFADKGLGAGHAYLLDPIEVQALNVLPMPVLVIGDGHLVTYANTAAEDFFQASASVLKRQRIDDLVAFGSPVLGLIEDVQRRGASVSEYRLDLGSPRLGNERIVDVFASPLPSQGDAVVLMLQERTIAEKMDRQLTHRGAARSITALGAMLAHEIKNPLSGIRGAAQLLEGSISDSDRMLTQLICDETDRIVKLVERVELFGDERPSERDAVNVHDVLDHVKRLARSGFARHIRFSEVYDPSLPPVAGNRDQLVQVLLNLVKNAAEAIGEGALDGEITLTTAYRPGIRMQVAGSSERIALPLEICIRDNGPGVPADLVQHLFDPFVTTKAQGSGLGLALVAKVIGDHGGIVECESVPRRTQFRILLPLHQLGQSSQRKA
ncbi:Sensory histidine kinase/phosphatase NtrB [Hyphomicrobiales bacterium]|nr:Sensory histidine kinase/phosphatase NtrB [Hyphomicrobiales bacterium]CAH1701752.1 Sensory histidine kinase/phosphatase NtrB [Hyphomicrobiales bacterium]CAI0345908.1 Sensory histidine kinase/phosphatase NtrB [Hyphomicrobiales bacterium]